jgi:hypothetical protein
LLDVEKQVWRVLFQMVEGLDLDGLLLGLVERIPWSVLASAPEGDRQWFALSTTSSQIADSSSSFGALQQTISPAPYSTPPEASQALNNQTGAQTNMDESPLQTPALLQADKDVPMDIQADAAGHSPAPSSTPPEASQALNNQTGSQTNMDESPLQTPALPQADEDVPMDIQADAAGDSPAPSSTPPDASEALNNQTGPQTNMDESPLQTPALPQVDEGVPMDIQADAAGHSTVNGNLVPEKDFEAARGGIDKASDEVMNEQEQQSNHVDEMVAQTESQCDAAVQSTKTPRLKRTSTPPKKALKKRQRHLDHEDYMPSSELSRETALDHLLAAGETYSRPIDVDAVDMLMRNFPITEEHQVCCAGYISLKPYLIIF